MKNILISTAVAAALGTISFGANATGLANGDTLTMDAMGSAVTSCLLDSPLPCTDPRFEVTSQTGSYFDMGGGRTPLAGFNGIVIGAIQAASGTHSGAPNGSESPNIDSAWFFASNTGLHQTTSPVTVISATELDFSGWSVTWNGIPSIAMGGCQTGDPANNGGFSGCDTDQSGTDNNVNTSTAIITINADDTYTLSYFANVPAGDPSGFGGAGYTLTLEGTVVHAVPVPAAVWLFGSGLIGLAGIARRRKANA